MAETLARHRPTSAEPPERKHARRAGTTTKPEEVRLANDTEDGLVVSYVVTADLRRAIRMIDQLETGMLGQAHPDDPALRLTRLDSPG